MESPEWKTAAEKPKPDRDTSKQPGYMKAAWKAARQYVGPQGEKIVGFDAAVKHLAANAEGAIPGGFAGKERKAGVWVLAGDPEGQAPLTGLGIDASAVSREQLGELLAGTNMRLHGFLRDQHHLSGLGRMLANEICHRARLSPFAMPGKLGAAGASAEQRGQRRANEPRGSGGR
jgi:formamidopyrimidine-DNA glycosylase